MSRRKLISLGSTLFVLGLMLFGYAKSKPGPIPSASLSELTSDQYRLVKVDDGDTIEVSRGLQKTTIRLIGIDTPEVVDPRKPVQCFGREASANTKSLLPAGSVVKLEFDDSQGQKDKYGRSLAYVYLPSGEMLNEKLVADGFAHEYTYQNNPYHYQARFKSAEQTARELGRGLWSKTSCNGDTTKPAG